MHDIHVHGGFVIFLSAPCEVRVRQSVPLSHWSHANILKAVCKSYGKQAHFISLWNVPEGKRWNICLR